MNLQDAKRLNHEYYKMGLEKLTYVDDRELRDVIATTYAAALTNRDILLWMLYNQDT